MISHRVVVFQGNKGPPSTRAATGNGSGGRALSGRRFAFAAVGMVLSAAGLWWVFRGVDPGELLDSSHRIRPLPLVGSLVVYWIGLVSLRGLLVRHLLAPVGRLRLLQACRYVYIGFLANNVLPLRAGDLARSLAIHRGAGIGFASVVGGLAVERMLDLALVALLALLALRVAPGLPEAVGTAALGGAAVLGAGFAVLAILARRRRGSSIEPAGEDDSRRSAFARVKVLWFRFTAGFVAFGTASGAAAAAGLAVAIWAVALGAMALRLWAFDLAPDPAVALVLMVALGLGVAVPSAPGYVGTYHAAVAFALGLFVGALVVLVRR